MRIPEKILITTLLLALPFFAHAQKWYQVEVIIFSQHDIFGDEGGPANLKLAYPSRMIDLANISTDGIYTTSDYQILDKSARQLNADAYTLNSTGVYKVLYHQAWRQAGLSANDTPWIAIQGGSKIAGHHRLEGSIRLYLSSYLHLNTNLWLVVPATTSTYAESATAEESGIQSSYMTTDELPPLPSAMNSPASIDAAMTSNAVRIDRVYTLTQTERLQLGKIHYLDHPKMGLLIKVTRAEPP
ncbi:MAG: hypothetical protein DRR42_13080 [Gammaproteobacteria bacterium]|nr:MAG: hypothetical protein DRR42_13080 [Gammaproteobacteria bacterium]